MNQRIKELAEQAGAKFLKNVAVVADNGSSGLATDFIPAFAELIVKDCIAEVLLYDCSSVDSNKETYLDGFIDGTERGYKDAVEQIAEGLALRYGVE